jgi:hypothetical protein
MRRSQRSERGATLATPKSNRLKQSDTKRKRVSESSPQGHLLTPEITPQHSESQHADNTPVEDGSTHTRPGKRFRRQPRPVTPVETELDELPAPRIGSDNYASRPRHEKVPRNRIEGLEKEREPSYDYRHIPVLPAEGQAVKSLVRILILHGGSHESPLSCSLKTLDLDRFETYTKDKRMKEYEDEKYEALSYVWGTPPPPEEMERLKIHIDDESVSVIRITPNLSKALKQLRRLQTNQNRRLWVDAVCIDQDSDAEKNSQVPLMAKIYSNSSEVCVWVGEESPDIETILAVNLVKSIRLLRNYDTFVEQYSQCSEWDALLNLMKREWFSRRWVVQEIAMAQKATIYCGEQYLDWNEFSEAVSLFQEMEDRVRQKYKESKAHNHPADYFGHLKAFSACHLVESVNQLVQKTEDGKVVRRTADLEELVSTLTAFRGSVPHDTIYAVLALANDVSGSDAFPKSQTPIRIDPETREKLQKDHPTVDPQTILRALQSFQVNKYPVNYKKDFVEVARDFLDIVTRRSSSLDMILRPWVDDRMANDIPGVLPSWIRTLRDLPHKLDYHNRHYQRVNANPLVGSPGKKVYTASGLYPGEWVFGKNPNCWTLTAKGFILDRVGEVEDTALGGTIPESWYDFGHWKDREQIPPQPFWRTIVADRDAQGEKCPLWYAQACKVSLGETVTGADAQTSMIKENINSQVVKDFLDRVQAVTWGRRLFKTSTKGWLGMGPNKPYPIKTGDAICILFGCSVPVILREQETMSDGSKHYKLIGESYVHGMMNGHALNERNDRSRKISNEDFIIH